MQSKKLTGFTPVLQIGAEIYKGNPITNVNLSLFQGVSIPKGKHNVQAKFISEDGALEIHAYQIRFIHR